MKTSQYMDKQIMDLASSANAQTHGKDFIDLMKHPEEEHQDGWSGRGDGDEIDGLRTEEIVPSYDFQPIRPISTGIASPKSLSLDGGSSARGWGSVDSKINTTAPIRSYSSFDSFEPAKVIHEKDKHAPDESIVSEIDQTIKKHMDNLLHALDTVSARLTQLESRTRNLENSVDELKVTAGNNHGSTDGKMRQLENILLEVQSGIDVIKDKQEMMEGQIKLSKLEISKPSQPQETNNSIHADSMQLPPQPSHTLQQPPPPPAAFQQSLPSLPPTMAPPPPPSQTLQPPPPPPSSAPYQQSNPSLPQSMAPPAPSSHTLQQPPPSSAPFQQPNPSLPPSVAPHPPPSQQILHPSVPMQNQFPQPPNPSAPQREPYFPPAPPAQPQDSLNQQYQLTPSQQPHQQYPPPQQPPYSQPTHPPPHPEEPPYMHYPPPGHRQPPPSQPPPQSGPPPPQQLYGSPAHMYEPPPSKSSLGFSSDPYPYGGSSPRYGSNPPSKSHQHSQGSSGGSYPQLPTARVLPQALPTASGINSGSGSSTTSNRLPVDDVVDKVATMGFPRDQVRATVRKLTENGQSVDLNVVLDKLMNDSDVQPPRGWFGR